MKIKVDENIPLELAQLLTRLGHDADTIVDEGLAGTDDSMVWKAAQDSQRLLITQDLGFLRYTPVQTWHPLWYRVGTVAQTGSRSFEETNKVFV